MGAGRLPSVPSARNLWLEPSCPSSGPFPELPLPGLHSSRPSHDTHVLLSRALAGATSHKTADDTHNLHRGVRPSGGLLRPCPCSRRRTKRAQSWSPLQTAYGHAALQVVREVRKASSSAFICVWSISAAHNAALRLVRTQRNPSVQTT